jgi:hypothetical protein
MAQQSKVEKGTSKEPCHNQQYASCITASKDSLGQVATWTGTQCGLRVRAVVAVNLKEFSQNFVANPVAPADFRDWSRRGVGFNMGLGGQ